MARTQRQQPQRERWTTTQWLTIAGDHRNGYARLRGNELIRAWGELLGRLPWEVFVTLTFDSKRGIRVNRDTAAREALWWLGLVAHLCRRPIAWAYAMERSASGLWHVHAVIIGAGKPNWTTLEDVWRMRNGMAVAKKVYNVSGVALYTTKGAADGEVTISDTVTLNRFKSLACGDIVVPLARE